MTESTKGMTVEEKDVKRPKAVALLLSTAGSFGVGIIELLLWAEAPSIFGALLVGLFGFITVLNLLVYIQAMERKA